MQQDILKIKEKKRWIAAFFLTAGVNLLLLSILPAINLTQPVGRDTLEVIHAVNVVRVKKPEVIRKKIIPPKKEEIKKTPKKPIEKPVPLKEPLKKLKLPFRLDPRIKSGLDTLPDLPIETVSIEDAHLGGIFTVEDLDQPLTAIAKVAPLYPIRAKREAIKGWVTVNFVVNEEGTVEQIEIVEGSPPGIFEKSVLRCISKWKFKPGTVMGEPVKTLVTTTVRFELEE